MMIAPMYRRFLGLGVLSASFLLFAVLPSCSVDDNPPGKACESDAACEGSQTCDPNNSGDGGGDDGSGLAVPLHRQ